MGSQYKRSNGYSGLDLARDVMAPPERQAPDTSRVDMVNERTGRRINVPNVPDAIERNRQLGYVIDSDPPAHPFRAPLPWRFDPEMPRVPRVATRFRGGRS